MAKPALAFDTMIMDSFRAITGLTTTELIAAQYQIEWPIREGGIGLVPYQKVKYSAYLASFAMAVPRIRYHPSSLQQIEVTRALTSLRAQGPPSELAPPTLNDYFVTYRAGAPPQLQRDLFRFVQRYEIDCKKWGRVAIGSLPVIPPLDRSTLIRLRSASGKSGAFFLTMFPSEHIFTLSADDLRLSIRHRLGLQPQRDIVMRSCPICGAIKRPDQPSLPHDHFHSCQPLRGSSHHVIISC